MTQKQSVDSLTYVCLPFMCVRWRRKGFQSATPKARDRDTKGVEGESVWGAGVSLPIQLGGLGDAVSSLSAKLIHI